MFGHKHNENDSDHDDSLEVQAELKAVFEKMPNSIDLILFSMPGENDLFTESARKVIHLVRDLSSKISLHEFNLDHKEAKKK